jgi:hypothetical protein
MRQEVLDELKKRIQYLETVAKPGEIGTGMSGSFVRFNMHLQSHTAMTKEEFADCVYDTWLMQEHKRVFNTVNKTTW